MSATATPKKLSNFLPPLKEQGMDYLVAAHKSGVSMQAVKVTQVGAAPLVVDLVALGLKTMFDTDYVVITAGETAARTTVDESTITPTGFSVLGGAAAEVHHLLVVGRFSDQAGE